MLFKRYASPLDLLKTYNLEATADFICYLIDEERESDLWEMWLHSQSGKSFKEFKKRQGFKKLRQPKRKKPITEEQEKTLLSFASQFVKPKTGGET